MICAENSLKEDMKYDIRGITRLLSSGAPASGFRALHFIVRLNAGTSDTLSPFKPLGRVYDTTLFQELEKILLIQPYSRPTINISFAIDAEKSNTVHQNIAAVLRDVFSTLNLRSHLHITSINGMWYV